MKAPIAIFAFNRPLHLKNLIDSLLQNEEFSQSEKFIFIDGPRNESDQNKIIEVEKLLNQYNLPNTIILKNQSNKGLADSIINGVNYVLNSFDSIIVLEDDLIVGKYFLDFMNSALNKYDTDLNIAQVSGFLFPIDKVTLANSSFSLKMTTTLGWGTWKRVWTNVDFYPTDWKEKLKDRKIKKKFDLNGAYPYSKMLKTQMESPNFGSWGIRFWWDIFKKGQLVIYPDYPLVQHKDFDLSGTHKSNYSHLDKFNWQNNYPIKILDNRINILIYLSIIKKLRFRQFFARRVINKIFTFFN
jgi:hypothetical protein